jgi:hypothetical protein
VLNEVSFIERLSQSVKRIHHGVPVAGGVQQSYFSGTIGARVCELDSSGQKLISTPIRSRRGVPVKEWVPRKAK